MLGKLVSIEDDILTIDQVQELNENTALSSNDNGNLKMIHLLPATKYMQMDVYDSEGKKDDGCILEREKWWKDTLCTKTHGYNKN